MKIQETKSFLADKIEITTKELLFVPAYHRGSPQKKEREDSFLFFPPNPSEGQPTAPQLAHNNLSSLPATLHNDRSMMLVAIHARAVVFATLALVTVLTCSAQQDNLFDGKILNSARPTTRKPTKRKAPTKKPTIPTITVKTTADNDFKFSGFPTAIRAGTYKITYINNSTIPHNFKIKGNTAAGFQQTEICSKCTKSMTVRFTRHIDGILALNRVYVCEPHNSKQRGTVKILPAQV